MSTEMQMTELPDGVRYRLPARNLGAFKLVGLFLFLVGLLLCSAPILPTWKLIQVMRNQIPLDDGMLWLFGLMVSSLCLRGGLLLAPIGLFILAGRSEIELRGSTLRSRECCGPVSWSWQRSTEGLRRFFVSDGLESFNMFGTLALGAFGQRGVITPEWAAVVGEAKTKPMWLAPGYPRDVLMPLADDLARRCAPVNEGNTVPVLERAPDFSEYEELPEQPVGSLITLEAMADGLTIHVPSGSTGGTGWYLGGGFLSVISLALATNLFEPPPRDMPLWVNVSLFVAAGLGGLAFIVAQANLNRRSVELSVLGDQLLVRQSDLFGTRAWQCSCADVTDIFVQHYPDSEGPDHWDLQIHAQGRTDFRCLAHQEVSELRWLATVLRRALHGGAQRGLVVRSPFLAVRDRC